MNKLLLGSVLGLIALASAACSGAGSTPTSPSTTPTAATGVGSAASNSTVGGVVPVGVSGTIRGLDTASRSFTLVLTSSTAAFARGDSRLVRADDATQLTIKGSPARFAALANGMTVAVRGTDQGRFIQAQSIAAR